MTTLSQISKAPTDTEMAWDLTSVSMEAWVRYHAHHFDFHVLHPRTEQATNLYRGFVSGTLAGVRYATGNQMTIRPQRANEESMGLISLQRFYSGSAAVDFADSHYVQRPGFIAISDFSREFRTTHHSVVGEGMLLPRSRLGISLFQPVEPILISVDSNRGRDLASEITRFFEVSAAGRSFDSADLEYAVRGILHESFFPASDREEWWRGRKQLIRKYIETHLEDPSLGPQQICQLFNMSRATLYRMFDTDGGVRRFIQDRRLYSAIWDLAIGGIKRGRLSRVADRWGFSSDANFNRAAKGAFGMPPGALFRKSAHTDLRRISQQEPGHPFEDWYEKLSELETQG